MHRIEEPVFIEDSAPPEHVANVEAAFRQAGFDVTVRADYFRKSADLLPWVVHVTLAAPVAAFFAAMAAEAGKDTYAAVKDWVREVWSVRRGAGTGEGSVVVRDSDGTNLVLSSSIPDEAIDALGEIDWAEQSGAYLVWDHDHAEWRDPTRRQR